jgi:hypothetical protein
MAVPQFYICKVRSDVPAALLQTKDLKPNSSQRHPVYESAGQTGYQSYMPDNTALGTLVVGPPKATSSAAYGLSAYLLNNVENVHVVMGVPEALNLTIVQAAAIATALIARKNAGTALALANINTVINAAAGVTDSDLNGVVADSHSTGTVEEILKILAGHRYYLPSGVEISDGGGNFDPDATRGWFVGVDNLTAVTNVEPGHASNPSRIRPIYISGSACSSLVSGDLAKMQSASFSYLGTTGRAISVYDYLGNVV